MGLNLIVFFFSCDHSRLMDAYKKIHKFAQIISYFSLQSWTFHESNTRSLLSKLSKRDQTLFSFDIAKLNWDDYFQRHVKGIRLYIIKDAEETLVEGRKHARRSVSKHTTRGVRIYLQ